MAYLGSEWAQEARKRLEAEFKVLGKYEVFAAISRGEMGSQRALMTGKLKLKGNMAKALRLAPLADETWLPIDNVRAYAPWAAMIRSQS